MMRGLLRADPNTRTSFEGQGVRSTKRKQQ